MSTNQQYDVIVIGGGASGMMAAGRAAERGRRVLLIEKNKELGKKLSISGGGRCNILNAENDTKKLLGHFGDAAKYLHSTFAQHGMQDSWDFFFKLGMPLVVEARKRAFPEVQSAPAVTKVMRRYCTDNNVELKVKVRAEGFLLEGKKIVGVKTNQGDFRGTSIVLATGGSSHPETGATGEGITWLTTFGHHVHEPTPNIVPLKVEDRWVHALSGRSLSFMKITFVGENGEKVSKTGKILFTHFGFSGPLILNAAHEVKRLLEHGPVLAKIDMYPDTDEGTVRNRVLEVFDTNKNKTLKNVLKEFVPAGMDDALIAQFDPGLFEKKVHSVSKEERQALVARLKGMQATVTSTMGLDRAVISDGGVDLSEVDTRTMASKIHPNLYFTGDVLHINRPSGGYGLQLCWSTGWVAGSHA